MHHNDYLAHDHYAIIMNRPRSLTGCYGWILALISWVLLSVAPSVMAQTLEFSPPAFTFALDENRDGSVNKVTIGTVYATGTDNITYHLSTANVDLYSSFEVNYSSGVVSYIGSGEDFEITPSYTLTVLASSSQGGGGSTTAEVIVTINDSSLSLEVPIIPLLADSEVMFRLGPTSPGVVVGTLTATDSLGDSLTYSIIGGDTDRFTLTAERALRYIGSGGEDVMLTPSYTLILATSNGVFDAVTTARIQVGICDRTQPVRDAITRGISLLISCADVSRDNVENLGKDNTSYSGYLTEEINGSGITNLKFWDFYGLRNVGPGIDLSNNQLKSLPASLFRDMTVLTDISLKGNQLSNLPEGMLAGPQDILRLDLRDNNLYSFPKRLFSGLNTGFSDSILGLQLEGNPGASFSIVLVPEGVEGGRLQVRSSHHTPRVITVDWLASGSPSGAASESGTVTIDTGTDTGSAPIQAADHTTVTLSSPAFVGGSATGLDVIVSSPPIFIGHPYVFTLVENQAGAQTPAVIGTVTANTADGGSLTYSLSVGDSSRFVVSANSGVISYIGSGEDFESIPSYTLTVQATDNAVATASASATVTVMINNINDHPPVFTTTNYQFTLKGTRYTPAAAVLGTVLALDPDGDLIAYSLIAGGDGRFVADVNGEVRYIGEGEDVTFSRNSYTLRLSASDGSDAATTAVSIRVVVGVCDRIQPVQQAILSNLLVENCGEVTLEQLSSITDNIFEGASPSSNQSITSLRSWEFAGLTGVVAATIDLSNNLLSTLPDGLFDDLQNVQQLDLQKNRLMGLPEGIFSRLANNLRILNLSHNRLSSLPMDALHLGELENIDLSYNYIKGEVYADIDGTYYEPVSPRLFDSTGTYIEGVTRYRLPGGLFAGMTSLSIINLENNYSTPLALDLNQITYPPDTDVINPYKVYLQGERIDGTILLQVISSEAVTALEVEWRADDDPSGNGDFQTGSVTIAAGTTTSAPITLNRNSYVRFNVTGAKFTNYDGSGDTEYSKGFQLGSLNTVTLGGIGEDIKITPGFTGTPYIFSLAENRPGTPAAPIGTIVAVPFFEVAVTYSLSVGDTTLFSIGTASGVLSYIGAGEDFETRSDAYALTVQATDSESSALSATAQVTVAILNLNDNTPAFELTAYAFTVAENLTGASVVIGSVIATDPDGATVTYSLNVGDTPLFSIGTTSGVLSYIGAGEDFETRSDAYTLTVQASDAGPNVLFVTAQVTVSIENLNDNPPAFELTAYTFALPENQVGPVGTVSATDADGGSLTYSVSGDDSSLFSVANASGVLSYIGAGEDFETRSDAYTLTVQASDAGPNVLFVTAQVTVSITNLNDNPPAFDMTAYTFSIPENQAGPELIGSVSASDADAGSAAPTYSVSGDDSSLFSVANASGVLSYIGAGEDFETRSDAYTLTVQASDAGPNVLFVTAQVTVSITNLNDNPPAFDMTAYTFSIPENQAGSVPIGTVSASDADAGSAAPTYSVSVDDSSLFSVANASGVLSYIGAGEDFETRSDAYTLTVQASDAGPNVLFVTAQVTVSIENLNDNPPAFELTAYTFALPENQVGPVGTVSATDADGGSLTYSVSGDDSSLFSVANASGVLSYIGAGEDFETRSDAYTLTVQASDAGPNVLFVTAQVTVSITNLNDNPPAFDMTAYTFSIPENQAGPELIGSVSASDADAGSAAPTYSVSGDDSSLFSIGTTSGVLSYIGAGEDFETRSDAYTLTVQASDAGPNVLFVTAQVTVSITNLNDNPPAFDMTAYTFSIPENQAGSVPIGTVSASDADAGSAAPTYSVSVDDSSLFSVANASGVISYIGNGEDFESISNYTLTVQASDTGPNVLFATAQVTVSITNLNDNTPAFGMTAYTFALPENRSGTPVAHQVGTVSATDADGSAPTYSLRAGDSSLFSIGTASGVLSYIGSGEDFEAHSAAYILTVQASDSVLFATAQVTVSIADVDDNLPVFALARYDFTLAENQTGMLMAHALGDVTATSPSGVAPIYSLTGGDSDRFSIAANNGALSYVGAGEDFESTPSYTLTVQANDANDSGLFVTTVVTVSITNLNDNPPAFGMTAYTFSIPENQAGPELIGSVSASDADGGSPTYSVSVGDSSLFRVATNSGVISYIGAGEDFETRSDAYTLTVQASDAGPNVLFVTAQVTVSITNLNDNPPAFDMTAYTFSIPENQAGPELIGSVSASDADAGSAAPTYSVSGDDSSLFSIGTTSGVLSYIGNGEDFESISNYTLTVQASDTGPNVLFATAQVTVSITNLNDNTPIFSTFAYTFSIPENQAGSVPIGTVIATDADGGSPTYSVSVGDSSLFSVANASGVISYIGSGEDFEAHSDAYILTVQASDSVLFATAQVTVAIENLNDTPPAFDMTAYTFSIPENQAGSVPIGTVTATDADGGSPTYSVSVGDSSLFRVATNSGVISYIGSGEDFEAHSDAYILTVQASDSVLFATAQVTVTIENLNDTPPAFDMTAYTFTVAENQSGAANPEGIGSVIATDPDGTAVTYSLNVGDTTLFSIGTTSGVLSYIGAGEDFESTPGYTLTVQASDAGPSDLFATAQVTVSITNLNDNTPIFSTFAYTFSIPENQAGSVSIGSVTATDADGDTLSYSLLISVGSDRFSIAATSGTLSYIGNGENFESGTSYALNVRVSGGGEMMMTMVTVTVTDVEEALVFAPASYTFTVAENQSGTATPVGIGSVIATDPDGAAVAYSLNVGDTTLFSIGTTSGVLSYIGAGEDFESTPGYTLTVQASDSSTQVVFAAVTVTVTDVLEVVDLHTQMMRMALAQISQNIGAGAVDSIGGRFVAAPQVTISGYALKGWQYRRLTRWMQEGYWQSMGTWDGVERAVSWDDINLDTQWKQFKDKLLSGTSFLVSLGAAEGERRTGLEGWSLWGKGRVSGSRYVDGGIQLSSRLVSGYLGVDYQVSDRLLLGVAVSQSRSDGRSEMAADGSNRTAIDTELTSVYPYLRWRSKDGFDAWGAIGRGAGEVEVRDAVQEPLVVDLEMDAVVFGLEQKLVTVEGVRVSLKADGFAVQLQSDKAFRLNATDSGSHRLRTALALAGSHRWSPSGNARFFGGVELGARVDGGDAVAGRGLDMGISFGYANPDKGLEAHSQARFLIAHSKEYSDWGLDVIVGLQPVGHLGRGLALALEPGWGQAATAIGSLWKEGVASLKPSVGGGRGFIPDRTRFSVRYGLHYRRALWSPFAEAGMKRDALSVLKLGLRVNTPRLQVEVFGNQDQTIGIKSLFNFW